VERSFDRFIDVRDRSDLEVARASREAGIDIAVDLGGLTDYSRTGIFAQRAAPVQVNYLGYPGTMGAEYIDYLIGDRTIIPPARQSQFSEKIVYLPHSFLPYDSTRVIDAAPSTREEFGLPASGFVFCCFNNSYKITPAVFDSWMQILSRVEHSVLWLSQHAPSVASNLLIEAAHRGIDKRRLVFAARVPSSAQHLARHRAADLFLDTAPYNAHATAIDALWAGLPVLTRIGESFASRVGASLLRAIELPELITETPEQYEDLAVRLAAAPPELARIRQKLAQNRSSTALFDTVKFTRDLESAYMRMYERYQANLPLEHIDP
jgi:predicted O-linked N-acetylglucosamine transferase (SPINDLY family)